MRRGGLTVKRILVLDLSGGAGGPVPWACGGPAGDVRDGILPTADALAGLDLDGVVKVVALVPGTDVLLRQVKLPPKGDALAALPFALEDDLAVDLDRLHFALGTAGEDGRRLAAAVDRERMEAWRDWLAPLNRLPVLLVPETAALDAPADAALVIDRGATCMVVSPAGRVAVERELLPLMLPPLLEGVGRIELAGDDGLLPADLPDGISTTRQPAPDGPGFCRLVLARMLTDRQAPLDLFQGPYRRRVQAPTGLGAWRRAAVLAAGLAGLHLGATAVTAWQMRAEAQALEQQAEAAFRQAFPDVTRIVNLRAQARARMAADQGGADAYLRLSGLLFTGLQALPGMAVTSLRFEPDQGDLTAELTYLRYGDMEALRTAVSTAGGRLVEGSARQEGDRTTALVTITIDSGAQP